VFILISRSKLARYRNSVRKIGSQYRHPELNTVIQFKKNLLQHTANGKFLDRLGNFY